MTILRQTGRFETSSVAGEAVAAFVPHPLPPSGPPLELDAAAKDLLQRAERALARLDLAGDLVPSLDWFIYAFVRKEAVLSSRIEGTQASLTDLFAFEAEEHADAVPTDDVEEVCNYLDALNFARAELRREGGLLTFPRFRGHPRSRDARGCPHAETETTELQP